MCVCVGVCMCEAPSFQLASLPLYRRQMGGGGGGGGSWLAQQERLVRLASYSASIPNGGAAIVRNRFSARLQLRVESLYYLT